MPRVGSHVTNFSSKILELTRASINKGKEEGDHLVEHFRRGGVKLFFPKARVILLRPNAKHSPYQAKFIVPKSFNKLDLKDYLFHLYGLRALNVTTQLLHAKYHRLTPNSGRFRGPQIKKMTIDMEQPFIWPEEPKEGELDTWNGKFVEELEKFREETQISVGSDVNKPMKAFDGVLGKYGLGAQPFIPRFLKNELENKRDKSQRTIAHLEQLRNINKFICRTIK
ncbi:hypothetical protein KAFR_0E03490 [Kazachstania africana CBS 2517]|uniref:Large ribosomal subunit protein uL23m n=1 Tax=Kazachstania africana (strain ATCC 22294 / BCRC 22015 / CBS 2517 / CECT 1963 / NBRC 1671 / NRRL Y-8276) TaxID=1071382 RepID=H2AVV0_KAZAF|nr:hypothetical protein KAFR_0E03490 [Kazachstania africana CBS 2517]CCF58500.1 hypothetical protein KAFR_0E03490 [Kazachstania africana CBS 2517]